jgi:hypothetical protein
MFEKCTSLNSPPHWANTCPQIAQHLSAKKALAAHRRVTKKERDLSSSQLDGSREPDYVQPSIPGYNAWPYDSGKLPNTTAILDTGANSTYVTHRLLLDNTTLPSSASVTVADGTEHPITASGTLLGHPSIRADLVSSFHQNLVGVSPILNQGPWYYHALYTN